MAEVQEILIKERAELQQHVSVSGELTIESLLPDLLDVQENDLAPILGDAFYTEVKGWYYGSYADGSKEAECIFRCQKIVANLALAQYQNIGQFKISDAGYTQYKTANSEPGKQWQLDDLRDYLYFKAYRAIDNLLKFLETNKTYFTTWSADTDAYTINKKFIVQSADQMQEYHDIQKSRQTYLSLLPVMKTVELFTIEASVGAETFERIKTEIAAADISTDINKILPYLQGACTKFTIAKACEQNLVEIRNNGFYVRSVRANNGANRERTQAKADELKRLKEACEADAQQYLKRAVDYLQKNASASAFPEFFEDDLYITEDDQGKIDYENTVDKNIFLM